MIELNNKNITRVRRDVMNSRMKALAMQPFFASVALQLNIFVCRAACGRTLPTAAVSGPNLYVNPDWYMELGRPAKIGLVMHEIMHKALGHDLRRGDRHPDVWNFACDYYINITLTDNKFHLPDDGLIDERFRGWSEEHIFQYMWERAKFIEPGTGEPSKGGHIDPDNLQIVKAGAGGNKSDGNQKTDSNDGGDGSPRVDNADQVGNSQGAGSSSESGSAKDGHQQGDSGSGGSDLESKDQGPQAGDGRSGGDEAKDNGVSGGSDAGGPAVDTTPSPGEGEVVDKLPSLNVPWGEVWDAQDSEGKPLGETEKKHALEKLKQDTVMATKAMSAGGSNMLTGKRIMDNLLKPKTDWRNELKNFISRTGKPKGRSYHRLDRRALAQDRYEPAEYTESVGRVVALWDVSSSMSWPAHRALLAQLERMREKLDMEELVIAPFNNTVQAKHVSKLKPKDKIPKEFAVGGGTNFNNAFTWVNNLGYKPDGVIVFTDLESRLTLPKPSYPVLWVSSKPIREYGRTLRGRTSDRPPWGKVVVIESGE